MAEDRRLRQARWGLVLLAFVGSAAIGWAAWLLTTATQEPQATEATQATGADTAGAIAIDTELDAEPTSEPTTEPTALPQGEYDAGVHSKDEPSAVTQMDPAVTPTSLSAEAAAGDAEPQVAVLDPNGGERSESWVPWGPEVVEGSNDVSFTLTVEVSDGGRETFAVADSFRGIAGVRGGETEFGSGPAGILTIEQRVESGWPPPDVACTGAEYKVDQGVVTLDVETGAEVACTFLNVRDEDSLSVLDTTASCAGMTGRVQGPNGPFWITYKAAGPPDANGVFTLFNVGTIRVERPGEFRTPPGFVAEAGLDDGEYPVWVAVRDAFGSSRSLLDATTLAIDNC